MKWLVAAIVAVALGIGVGESLLHLPGVCLRIARELGLTNIVLCEMASHEPVNNAAVDREMQLLRDQFANADAFRHALQESKLSEPTLRNEVTEQLREVSWIEAQIAPGLAINESQLRASFEQRSAEFQLPQRFHVAHIFLAAHAQTPAAVVEQQREAIADIAEALQEGGDFAQIASERSEDEATKQRGGDLGWLSHSRVWPEIFAAIEHLHVGETSAIFRSHLGFHIFRLLEMQPARAMSFDEARDLVAADLQNAQRREGCSRIGQQFVNVSYRTRR
jgi:parvulin-like peptidyl-prolyl isomerase